MSSELPLAKEIRSENVRRILILRTINSLERLRATGNPVYIACKTFVGIKGFIFTKLEPRSVHFGSLKESYLASSP